ncbi:hypothetical protein F0562_030749 [Nyssa sinensis]|uniref:RRM domain-containing protein n=1 Tax=Nyssa sinensis TaxID=561372 RepID=A0A5J5AZE1_9ASTE|nr:hypothetical protein F0562_030749 [Nyssa sinensis]
MNRLRMLIFRNIVTPSRRVEYLPPKLMWLEWNGYPSKSLPRSFDANGLRGLIMCGSGIKRPWKGKKQLHNLTVINLSKSYELRRIPDFSGVPNLEILDLHSCTNLVEVHPSIGVLKKLTHLYLWYCENLKSFPSSIQLPSLEYLDLHCCLKLKKFPEIHGNMERLSKLYLAGTGIKDLPSSIQHLTNLSVIWLYSSKNLRILSSAIGSVKSLEALYLSGCLSLLTELHLSDCNMLDGALPSDIGNLSSLEELNLGGNNFVNLPESINRLSRLEILRLVRCKDLEALPRFPSNIVQLTADECPSLKDVPVLSMNGKLVAVSFMNCFKLLQNNQSENMAEKLLLWMLQALVKNDRGYGIFLPGIEIPQYFSHQNPGHSITIQLQPEESYTEPAKDAKIFVGNLPFDVKSEKLAHLFEQAGVVEIAEVIYNRETDRSRGFGFVTMSTVEDAEKAVLMFHRYSFSSL